MKRRAVKELEVKATDALDERRKKAARLSGGQSQCAIIKSVTQLTSRLNLDGDALDFGAGKGHTLCELHKLERFQSLAGIDILEKPNRLPPHARWISQDLNHPCLLKSESMDCIFAIEVIEHLENPRHQFREWARILRPGGHLFVSTPNTESFRSLLSLVLRGFPVAFGPNDYPAHITPIYAHQLLQLGSEAGFSSPSIHWVGNGVLPFWTKLKWSTLSLGLLKGRRFSDNVLAVYRKLS